MRKSLWSAHARLELIERLDSLNPDAAPRWGAMNAPAALIRRQLGGRWK